MYLQLAEDRPISKLVTDNYTFVPGANGDPGIWVRDDSFDQISEEDHSEIIGAVGMSELSASAKKQARRLRKEEKKGAKTDIKKARAEAIRSGKGGQGFKDIIGSVGSVAGQIFGKGGSGSGAEFQGGAESQGADESKPFYKNPIFIGAGILVLVGGIYLATRKSK